MAASLRLVPLLLLLLIPSILVTSSSSHRRTPADRRHLHPAPTRITQCPVPATASTYAYHIQCRHPTASDYPSRTTSTSSVGSGAAADASGLAAAAAEASAKETEAKRFTTTSSRVAKEETARFPGPFCSRTSSASARNTAVEATGTAAEPIYSRAADGKEAAATTADDSAVFSCAAEPIYSRAADGKEAAATTADDSAVFSCAAEAQLEDEAASASAKAKMEDEAASAEATSTAREGAIIPCAAEAEAVASVAVAHQSTATSASTLRSPDGSHAKAAAPSPPLQARAPLQHEYQERDHLERRPSYWGHGLTAVGVLAVCAVIIAGVVRKKQRSLATSLTLCNRCFMRPIHWTLSCCGLGYCSQCLPTVMVRLHRTEWAQDPKSPYFCWGGSSGLVSAMGDVHRFFEDLLPPRVGFKREQFPPWFLCDVKEAKEGETTKTVLWFKHIGDCRSRLWPRRRRVTFIHIGDAAVEQGEVEDLPPIVEYE
ncbi:hypothetical protein ACP70R_019122 [Stipagrostis hirtigluma subsp. patula]